MLDSVSSYLLALLVFKMIGKTFVDAEVVNCFLCGSSRVKRTRERRPVDFHINRYFYKCTECKGYSLWPKLEDWEIQKLYSVNYIGDVGPASSVDYASPGAENSQISVHTQKDWFFTLNSRSLSPDMDGFEDLLILRYKFPEADYLSTIKIFNIEGKEMKTLIKKGLDDMLIYMYGIINFLLI